MTDQPGKRMGQQGREEVAALSDEELNAKALELGVATTNDDGTPRERSEIVNEVANKIRQAERGQPVGGGEEEEVPEPSA